MLTYKKLFQKSEDLDLLVKKTYLELLDKLPEDLTDIEDECHYAVDVDGNLGYSYNAIVLSIRKDSNIIVIDEDTEETKVILFSDIVGVSNKLTIIDILETHLNDL